jgi:hypothetical protein
MPGFFGADVFVQTCPIIVAVDDWLNSEAHMTQTASVLGEDGSFAFVSGGPLENREDETAWDSNDDGGEDNVGNWVDAAGHGGRYWRYARDINLSDLIKNGLSESVQLASSTNKLHNTLWVVSGPPPSGNVDAETQQRLFRVGVHETDRVVSLVIMTPTPLDPSSGA